MAKCLLTKSDEIVKNDCSEAVESRADSNIFKIVCKKLSDFSYLIKIMIVKPVEKFYE